MGHNRLNLLLGATFAGIVCIGNTAAALTGTGFLQGLHTSPAGSVHLLKVAALPPPPPPPPPPPAPPPPAQAAVPAPTARTSSVVTALQHLGRVWESPPPDRAGVGTLAERFKNLFRSAGEQFSELGGQTVDQVVATVAGPGAVDSLNAAYAKVRRAYATRQALPVWRNSAQYQYFQDQRGAITQEFRRRALDLARKNGLDDRIANDALSGAWVGLGPGDYPIVAQFRNLREDRDARIKALNEGKAVDQFAAAYLPQAEAAQQAYEEALAELDSVSQDLVARFDKGTDVEYTLDASVTPQPFDDVSSGCMQSVADSEIKCGRKLATDFLDKAIEATDSKSGKFYQELRKVLAKPEDQITREDKVAMAKSIRELFGDRAGGFGTIADGMLKGKEGIDNAVDFAKKINSIINRDPDDPLAELKAFKTYLGLGQKFAKLVPGMGEMYTQYVTALDGIIANAGVIAAAKTERENATQLFGDVIEGIYREDKKAENSKGAMALQQALTTLSGLDQKMLIGEASEGWKLTKSAEEQIFKSTRVEREDYDKARKEHENVIAQRKKKKEILNDARRKLEKILKRKGQALRNPRTTKTGEIVTSEGKNWRHASKIYKQARKAFTALQADMTSHTADAILKRAEPDYLQSVAAHIGAIAAKFPRDATLKKWVPWAGQQRKAIANLDQDWSTSALILSKAETRYTNRLIRLTQLALSNPHLRYKV